MNKDSLHEIISSSLFYNFEISFKISSITGLFLAVLIPELSIWYENNMDYVKIALSVIAIDHILGTVAHSRYYKNDWNWRKNITGFFVKLSMVVAFGFIMEGLAHVTVDEDFIYRYVKMSGRILVILYPGLSAIKNISYFTNGDFPGKIFFKKLKDVAETGDINKLKKNHQNENGTD